MNGVVFHTSAMTAAQKANCGSIVQALLALMRPAAFRIALKTPYSAL